MTNGEAQRCAVPLQPVDKVVHVGGAMGAVSGCPTAASMVLHRPWARP